MHRYLNDLSADNATVCHMVSRCYFVIFVERNASISVLLDLQVHRAEIRHCAAKIFFSDLPRNLDDLNDNLSPLREAVLRLESYIILLSRHVLSDFTHCLNRIAAVCEEKRNRTSQIF